MVGGHCDSEMETLYQRDIMAESYFDSEIVIS